MNFEVKEEVLQAVVNYLGKQPYVEVRELINEILKSKQLEVKNAVHGQEEEKKED